MLFSSLYRSWCHNPVAVFALCLLAQAYEHASNLLQIFAELELTVSLLVQIDKLVMLIESPVFTSASHPSIIWEQRNVCGRVLKHCTRGTQSSTVGH